MGNKAVRIRYLGVQAVDGGREYGFSVDEPESHCVVLLIRNSSFSGNLSYQEAPGLCYEKLCAEIDRAGHTLFADTIEVTPDDCARYRENHVVGGKQRRSGAAGFRSTDPRSASLDIGASSVRRRSSVDS
jgi:hypothetical protein